MVPRLQMTDLPVVTTLPYPAELPLLREPGTESLHFLRSHRELLFTFGLFSSWFLVALQTIHWFRLQGGPVIELLSPMAQVAIVAGGVIGMALLAAPLKSFFLILAGALVTTSPRV